MALDLWFGKATSTGKWHSTCTSLRTCCLVQEKSRIPPVDSALVIDEPITHLLHKHLLVFLVGHPGHMKDVQLDLFIYQVFHK